MHRCRECGDEVGERMHAFINLSARNIPLQGRLESHTRVCYLYDCCFIEARSSNRRLIAGCANSGHLCELVRQTISCLAILAVFCQPHASACMRSMCCKAQTFNRHNCWHCNLVANRCKAHSAGTTSCAVFGKLCFSNRKISLHLLKFV